jgi:ABC-type siderophore export system fused ATPase/permease subunit
MKDRLALILTGGVAAIVAAAFWRYLGQDAFSVLSIVAVLTLTADNVRLRRQLRDASAAKAVGR